MNRRTAAVAGTFYPGDPAELAQTVRDLLAAALEPAGEAPKALILPHAGFVYSGPVAASGYRYLAMRGDRIRRVVLLGPAHRVHLTGMAVPSADAFETPAGTVRLDGEAIESVLASPGTRVSDSAHALEHCLEVQLPFLQAVLDDFVIVPIVVGQSPPAQVAGVIEALWGGKETVVIVSSDLSHYHNYDTATRIDARTTAKILSRSSRLDGEEACGANAINGLMLVARGHDLSVRVLDVRNSGDTAGDRRQVVGYGAYALG